MAMALRWKRGNRNAMSRLRQCPGRQGLRHGASRERVRLVSILLVALLVAATQGSAAEVSETARPSTGEVHGATSDESRVERDVGQSGSSAPEQRAKPLDPAQRGLLPFIILKSIERPFMMSPPR